MLKWLYVDILGQMHSIIKSHWTALVLMVNVCSAKIYPNSQNVGYHVNPNENGAGI